MSKKRERNGEVDERYEKRQVSEMTMRWKKEQENNFLYAEFNDKKVKYFF